MQFEWDRKKARQNFIKHNISFDEAMTVFYDPLATTFDDQDHSIEEQRMMTIGLSSKGRIIFVSHTERGKALRIISARIATANERKQYESQTH